MEGTEQPLHDDYVYVYAVKDEEAYLQADDEKPPIPHEPFPLIVCQFCGKPFEQVAGLFEANAASGIPTPQPSRPCGSATSALPGWRRYSPRSPQALTGSDGGGNGHPAASCDRRIGRATTGPHPGHEPPDRSGQHRSPEVRHPPSSPARIGHPPQVATTTRRSLARRKPP